MPLPLFQFLNPLHAPLRVRDHLAEQVGEARLTDLGGLGAIEWSVVDGLSIARKAQPRLLARGSRLQIRHVCE